MLRLTVDKNYNGFWIADSVEDLKASGLEVKEVQSFSGMNIYQCIKPDGIGWCHFTVTIYDLPTRRVSMTKAKFFGAIATVIAVAGVILKICGVW